MKRLDAQGFSLVKLMFMVLIFAIIAQCVVLTLMVMGKKTVSLEDHCYASVKGAQMYNELQAYANNNPYWGGQILDGYNDGTAYSLLLTADKSVTQPDDPLSGNRLFNGHWRYLRQIQVEPGGGPYMSRNVVVYIWRCESDGNTKVPGLLLNTTLGNMVPGTSPTYTQTPAAYTLVNTVR